jgi:glycosyltransferase involved in cell wall biosynthesis
MISVVIPAYNEEKYIRRCLESLRTQNFDEYEIVVVDNASTDKTREIAEKYADKVIFEGKKGVVFARQKGFEEAEGDVIASTDADTVVGENWLQEIHRAFEKKIAGVYGPVFLLDGNKIEKALAKNGFTLFLMINHMLGIPHFVGMNFAIKKELFLACGGFDIRIKSAEDLYLSSKIKKLGRIYFNKNMVVYTSARRLKSGYLSFLKHHGLNYIFFIFLGKTRDFKDIR